MECWCCGDELEGEELDNPAKDEDGHILCDDCYEEEYMFTCYKCGNHAHITQ